jgi:hypothetical protein
MKPFPVARTILTILGHSRITAKEQPETWLFFARQTGGSQGFLRRTRSHWLIICCKKQQKQRERHARMAS